jgi:hypothetical protein
VLRAGTAPQGQPPPASASDRRPPASLQPPAPRADRTAAVQRGRGCRAEAAPPPGGRAAPRSGSMSAAEAAESGQNRPKSGPATLSDRCPRGTPGRPPAGYEAPARAQPSPLSTLGGQSGDLAPRELGARLLRAGGACCGQEPHPGGPRPPASDRRPPAALQPPPPRADRPAALLWCRGCRAEAAPPLGGRAAPRSGSMSAAQAAESGQNRPKRAQKRLGQMPQRNAWAPSGPV